MILAYRRHLNKTTVGFTFGPALKALLIAATIYALSNEVYVGPLHLLHWRVPGDLRPLFETFRSSGRFFWLVSYALVLFAVDGYLRLRSTIARAGIAVGIVALQFADLYPILINFKHALVREPNEPANISQWNVALAGVKTIHVFPKFKCDGALIREILPLQMVAAKGGYNLTTGFISRYGADCNTISAEIANSNPTADAYVFTQAQFSNAQIRSYLPDSVKCRQLDIWLVCRSDWS